MKVPSGKPLHTARLQLTVLRQCCHIQQEAAVVVAEVEGPFWWSWQGLEAQQKKR